MDPPNYKAMPDESDVLDSTILMITVSYNKKRFFRCCYLIRQFYKDEALNENPPETVMFDKLWREIKIENPIITLYDMIWDEKSMQHDAGQGGVMKEEFKGVDLLTKDTQEADERKRTLEQLKK